MWDLSPSSLADQSAEGPGPREAVGYRTQQANASHSGAFPVGAAGQVGRKSPGPFGLIAKGKSRDPHEARQPDNLTQETNASRSGAFLPVDGTTVCD